MGLPYIYETYKPDPSLRDFLTISPYLIRNWRTQKTRVADGPVHTSVVRLSALRTKEVSKP